MRYYLKFLLGTILFGGMSLPCFAQWDVQYIITKANCKEELPGGGEIKVTKANGPLGGPYTYSWNTGSTNLDITNLAAGSYTLFLSGGGIDTSVVINVMQGACDPAPERLFTPNADGVNDVWAISNAYLYPNLFVSVYNRWGELVYEKKGAYVPWDGRNLFELPVDPGTYFYVIYKDSGNLGDGIVTGSVNIIR